MKNSAFFRTWIALSASTAAVAVNALAGTDIKSNFTASVQTADNGGNNLALAYDLSGLGNNAHYSTREYGDQVTLAPNTVNTVPLV